MAGGFLHLPGGRVHVVPPPKPEPPPEETSGAEVKPKDKPVMSDLELDSISMMRKHIVADPKSLGPKKKLKFSMPNPKHFDRMIGLIGVYRQDPSLFIQLVLSPEVCANTPNLGDVKKFPHAAFRQLAAEIKARENG